MVLLYKKICVKYRDYDLLRIIPFSSGSDYDFKIDFLNNNYQLRMHPVDVPYFETPDKSFNLNQWSITYHKKTEGKSAKFHLKSNTKPVLYHNLPLKKITDPIISSEFPIPLMKIGVSKNDKFKSYKNKKQNYAFDIKDSNVVEIYLVGSHFDLGSFINKWEFFDFLYTIAPMEYLVNGRIVNGFKNPKLKAIYENESLLRTEVDINKDIRLLFTCYRDDNIDG